MSRRFNPKTADGGLVRAFEDVYANFEWKQLPHTSQVLKQLHLMKRGREERKERKFAVGVITNNDERVHELLEKEGFSHNVFFKRD